MHTRLSGVYFANVRAFLKYTSERKCETFSEVREKSCRNHLKANASELLASNP